MFLMRLLWRLSVLMTAAVCLSALLGLVVDDAVADPALAAARTGFALATALVLLAAAVTGRPFAGPVTATLSTAVAALAVVVVATTVSGLAPGPALGGVVPVATLPSTWVVLGVLAWTRWPSRRAALDDSVAAHPAGRRAV